MPSNLLPILLLGLAALVVLALVTLGGVGRSPYKQLPYRRVVSLLTPAELEFYRALRGALTEGQELTLKVRVADLLEVAPGVDDRLAWFNKIAAKHVDFVVCDATTLAPLAAVELDDASHARPERRQRDAELDAAFAAAGLPMVRVPAAGGYDVAALATALAAATGGKQNPRVAARKTGQKRT